MESTFSLLVDGRTGTVSARLEGDLVRLTRDDVTRVLGWEIKPQGLCKGERCIPVHDPAALADERGIDLCALARLLGRPLAVDAPERAACLGTSAAERGARLATLEAPDFTLPDMQGRPHSLSEQRGKKVLLVAYASW
jgi:hypothetical protein